MPRIKTLVPQSYGPGVTRIHEAFGGTGVPTADLGEGMPLSTLDAGGEQGRDGPIVTNSIPFRLVAGVALNIINANPFRKGLVIQNLDPVTNLNVSFGTVADATSFALPPNSVALFDFITPTDAVWLFGTLAISGFVFEFAPRG